MLKKNCFVLITVLITVFMCLASTDTVYGEEILLTWEQNQEEELAGYNVYYSNSSGSYVDDPISLPKESLTEVDGTVSFQFPTALSPDLTHYFSITAYDIWGYETGFSNEVRFPLPEGGSIIINNNDLVTYSPDVILTIFTTADGQELDANAQMTFSNDNEEWSDPEPYANTKAWILSPVEGVKTVYARFSDATGNWLPDTAQDQIVFEGSEYSCDEPQMLSPLSITASSVSPFSAIEYALDGNPVTAWSTFSFFQKEEYITLDLGELKRVSSFNMFAAKLYGLDYFPANFQIQTSRDNINWLTVSSERGYSSSFEPPYSDSWNFNNLSCRYVRVYITRAKTLLFFFHIAQIAEVEVYGCDVEAYVSQHAGENFLPEDMRKKETGEIPLGEVPAPVQGVPSVPGRPEVDFK